MAGDMILDNIEEFLFDEDRVVSYKWLSRTLSLHVNQAKSKLAEFAEHWREKKESNPITLTFFISGTQETKSGNELNKVAIVKEENLENVKKSLKKTLCEHIYSIQKSTLKDTAALYQTDFDITKQNLSECNKYSAITCKAAKAGSTAASSVIQTSSVPNGQGNHHNESKKDKSPPKVGSSSNDKRKKPGLAAFMTKSKTEAKSKVKSEVNEIPKETAAKKTNKEPKKGSLMHAFHSSQKIAKPSADQEKNKETNNDLSKSSKESIDEAKSAKNKQTKSTKTTERKTSSSEGEEEETSQPMKVTPVKKQTTKTTEKKEKQNVESKKAKKRGITKIEPDSIKENGSKRRRVIRMEESSSSEDEESDVDMLEQDEEEMDDTPIPPTPEPRSTQGEHNQSSQGQETCGNKRKKVWKKKRYVDNEGCMVTEKVFDYESGEGSETEEQAQPSKEESSPSGGKKETSLNSTSSSPSTDKGSKKGSPPSSGRKQTALTSFFKKM